MTYQLNIQCQQQTDVVERVLRIIRHRGFTLDSLNLQPSACQQQIQMVIAVSSTRPIQQLTTQLEKLYDVIKLTTQRVSHEKSYHHAGTG